jgi:hypothetical protein
MKIQGATIGYLKEAYGNDSKEELIAANILHKLYVNYT